MYLSYLSWFGLVLAALTAVQAGGATEPVAVRVLAVEESRRLDVGTSAERAVFHSNGLKLTVELSGAPIETATGCGALKLEKALDDKGKSLLGDPGSLHRSNLATFEKINRDQMWFFADVKPKDKIKVEIELNPATRSAVTLKALTGSIRVGRSTDIAFPDLPAKVGKPLEDKALADAGVSLTLTKAGDKGSSEVSYTMNDPNGYVAEVRLVDASGKDVTRGRSSMRFGNLNSHTVEAGSGPMPAGVKLVVALMTPATVLTVPIDLKDVPLP
jgi:hypothetical protein